MIKTYRDLFIWQKSMVLVTKIYQFTHEFPTFEIYSLSNQMRRAATSIPTNIAEGYGRKSTGDYKRFLTIGISSLYELQTQLEIAYNLKYLQSENFQGLYEDAKELERMMTALISKL